MIENHILPDVLAAGLRVIFCGPAPGKDSARAKAYYANPRNRFWTVLHETDLTPIKIEPQEYNRVLDFGIGLTDLCKTASGNNNELPPHCLEEGVPDLRKKIAQYRPTFLAFTDPTAGKTYLRDRKAPLGRQGIEGGTIIYLLPSPSPRNTQWSKHRWIWQDFSDTVRIQPGG